MILIEIITAYFHEKTDSENEKLISGKRGRRGQLGANQGKTRD
jgi:hypothetical protein